MSFVTALCLIPVKTTGNGLAAFYHKIYGYFFAVHAAGTSPVWEQGTIIRTMTPIVTSNIHLNEDFRYLKVATYYM